MTSRILTLRELNRATLSRQMLLAHESLSIPAAIERLVGMQAQVAQPPYVGLWTRLTDFKRDDLARLIADHTVIKATLMRGTLHLFTAEDFIRFRETLQPALSSGWAAIAKRRDGYADVNIDQVLATGKQYLAEQPRTFAEITKMYEEQMPGIDVGLLRYGLRTHLPLIQVPNDSLWSYPSNPAFTLAESWLGKDIDHSDNLPQLIRRYLAAFGPASITDMQTWSALPNLKEAFAKLKPELVTYRDEQKTELYDLPDMPLPDADTPAPERFLPEFDNILLSHKKRTRILADAHRKKVYLPGLRVAATFLVDGFVRGVWTTEKKKGTATLTMEPLEPLTKQNRAALTDEAEKLIRFVEPDAKAYEVKIEE